MARLYAILVKKLLGISCNFFFVVVRSIILRPQECLRWIWTILVRIPTSTLVFALLCSHGQMLDYQGDLSSTGRTKELVSMLLGIGCKLFFVVVRFGTVLTQECLRWIWITHARILTTIVVFALLCSHSQMLDYQGDLSSTERTKESISMLMGLNCKLLFRGGSFDTTPSRCGVFALNLNQLRTYSDNNIGFRSALLS